MAGGVAFPAGGVRQLPALDAVLANKTPEEEFIFSPETLLAYCQRQLNKIDEDIKACFVEQKADLKIKDVLRDAMQALQNNSNGFDDLATRDALLKKIDDLRTQKDAAPGSPPLPKDVKEALDSIHTKLQLTKDGKDVNNKDHTDTNVSAQEIKDYVDQLKTVASGYDSKLEYKMIGLQSHLGRRQQAIQLVTNCIQAAHQALMAPINNLKG
jgi:hypothetical protein